MTRVAILVPALLCCAGCADFPRDSDGTSQRLQGGALRVGWAGSERGQTELKALASALAADAAARLQVETGAAEPLLARLEAGELDLVLGDFDEKSPWIARVTFSKPVAGEGEPVQALAATRNGEHRWAMAVDRAIAARTEPR